MAKFKNKYRIEPNRKPNWDYSAEAIYFLTINTKNRDCNLGEIVNDNMILSDFGKIVETEWYTSFEIRNELILHQFVIMPNHLHAMVEISTRADTHATPDPPIETDTPPIDMDGRAFISIKRNAPIRLPKSISSFMAGFKSAVNTKIDDYIDEQHLQIPKYNRNNHFFQPNYHDHIIRNDFEYHNISNYILNNPANWVKDTLNKNG